MVVESKRTATATPKLHVRSMRYVICGYPSISWCPDHGKDNGQKMLTCLGAFCTGST